MNLFQKEPSMEFYLTKNAAGFTTTIQTIMEWTK